MVRTYDAARSRERLLEAAHALFSERGFEGATTRQIAERADVDAALIARYFGNKEKLYIAAVALDGPTAGRGQPATLGTEAVTAEGVAAWLLRRTRATGPGPVMQALVRGETAPEIRAAAIVRVHQLFIDPLAEAFAASGVAEPGLRAEFVVFATLGLVIGRALPGSELSSVDHDHLVGLIRLALSAVLGPAADAPS